MHLVRIWIKKEGKAKYISHLDMNRCFTRAVRRAGINLWYTEGYNPRPYLNFLTPLSLGQESEGEPLDIKVEDDMSNREIYERLDHILPEGLTVNEVCEPISPSSAISAAEYTISLEFAQEENASSFSKSATYLISSGDLTAEKQGKKGKRKVIKTINICDAVIKFESSACGNTVNIHTSLATGSVSNLNPTLLLSALKRETELLPEYVLIKRLRLLKADETEFR